MNIIKNILLVSYIKNKGWRRLAFVVGLSLFIFLICTLASNYHPVDNTYENLIEMHSDIGVNSKKQYSYWYKELDCAVAFIEKKGLKHEDAYSLFSFNKYEEFCDLYPQQCEVLSKTKDNQINLKCNGFENIKIYKTILVLTLSFYLPFILLCILKLTFKLIKWIYDGFLEK